MPNQINRVVVSRVKPQLIRKRVQVYVNQPPAKVLKRPTLKPKPAAVPSRPAKAPELKPSAAEKSVRPPALAAISRQQLIKKRSAKKPEVKYITADVNVESINKVRLIKDSGKGKILIMVGNGPSILEVDLQKLKHHPKIEILSINTPDKRIWPTDYWAFFDLSQFRRHEDLWNHFNGTVFNSTAIKRQKQTSMQFKNLNTGGKGWSRDLSKGIYIGRSSVFASMQIAAWMDHFQVYIFGCLPDGEKILTNRGMVSIDSLFEDDLVYSTNGFSPITNYQRRLYNGILVSIVTRMNNIPLRLTAEHPILTLRNNEEIFIEANDLNINDFVVYPIDMTVTEDNHSENFWWLVGAYAAEGYIRIDGKYKYATLCVGKHENNFINEIRRISAVEFGCKVTDDRTNRTAAEQIINNDSFGQFVASHIGRGSTTKFLSDKIFTLSLAKQAAFIKGYCQGDGSLFKRKARGFYECTFSTASESLAEGIQKLLLRLGVLSSLVRSNRPSGFDRTNSGNYGIRHHVNIIGSSLDILAKKCGWKVRTSRKNAIFGTRIANNKLYIQIRQLTKLAFVGYVNNIEVAGPNTFASRLMMTHNCDMAPEGLNGMLHFYGENPDVKPEIRRSRFNKEAEYYDFAADTMSPDERQRFTFCSDYNVWPFTAKFNKLSHKTAVDHILKQAQLIS